MALQTIDPKAPAFAPLADTDRELNKRFLDLYKIDVKPPHAFKEEGDDADPKNLPRQPRRVGNEVQYTNHYNQLSVVQIAELDVNALDWSLVPDGSTLQKHRPKPEQHKAG